ncbi:glycoside hydrolase family 38 [Caldithrix abyssi DSM 13497]|uniref:Alpha-mannosidase n=1 Tax=Caldithrix abyssi DSM 13497 TaxID=880073 RepID=H1XSQ5_CALAY|nr:alpha-mannosidase [Caldithrix abyssi]APF20226.1 alpha-mannosidase [Caldithrix abyssi DSM 13497]EHO40282.1 glycoside hydrolase family 38 [Caldithrix abyssi DSM 13497]
MALYDLKDLNAILARGLKQIEKNIYTSIADLTIKAWITREPVSFENRKSGEERTLKIGDKWGSLFDCAWFLLEGKVPESAKGKNVVLLIDLNGEAMVVDSDGNPVLGLTSGSSVFDTTLGKPVKQVVPFKNPARGGETIALWLDVGNNDLFGNLQNGGKISRANIAICNDEMRSFYYDFHVLFDLMSQLPKDSARYHRIANSLYNALLILKEYTEEEAAEARRILAPELAKKNGDYSLLVSAIGHAHLDLAWLWPIRETIRKGARTFSTVLKMMDMYPEFIFGASQPQLYEWMKEYYPSLYARIKEKIKQGRWEPLGAMWVESDTNLVGGESLVRQFLYGKRFFQKEFGKDIKNLFLPDTFGYTAALPQIMKKCGVEYFLTIKLSWDRFNTYPHHTFKWKGLDGSEVLVHMPPEGTYNSSAAPHAVLKTERQFLDKGVSENCLLVYGIGDGGGGPGMEHLERLAREKNLEGMAPVVQEPVSRFLERIEENRNDYASWSGELYLGVHQGTYTTQGSSKRFNRVMEIALRELEMGAVFAKNFTGLTYPQEKIEKIWKEVLLYQFHDILPGSSITRVYSESLPRYEKMLSQAQEMTDDVIKSVASVCDSSNFEQPIYVYNSLSWERKVWLKVQDKWYRTQLPSIGYTVIEGKDDIPEVPGLTARKELLENDCLRVRFADDGSIISIFDKDENREIIPGGEKGNVLKIYYDDGDAWDFFKDYHKREMGQFILEDAQAYVDGPRAVLVQRRKYKNSSMTQTIVLTAGSNRIDFITEVDWQESNKMLRTSFPVTIHTQESTSEIQFGYIKRPTHQNTSWEVAKFEISAHKWVDLSQKDYGVALLNNSKYGHKVFDNILDLNLIRSPQYPDPEADRTRHEFTYSLLPHPGDFIAGGVIQAGYELNMPVKFLKIEKHSGVLPPSMSFVQLNVENVIVETIKKAEDNNAIIVRLYEAYGMQNTATISFGFKIKEVYLTNMLEEVQKKLELKNNNEINLNFKPFEIHTLQIYVEK